MRPSGRAFDALRLFRLLVAIRVMHRAQYWSNSVILVCYAQPPSASRFHAG